MDKPPAAHYLTHLPKHPGCSACNNCKVQRKHCRDRGEARKRRSTTTIKLDTTPTIKDDVKDNKSTTPEKFGDLITSDSIFVTERGAASAERPGDTTALVIRDRGSGWVMGYPSKGKTSEGIKGAVIDINGAEAAKLWYSDGAPELHAACRELGIRHDTADPHRSETNGVIERTNRTGIESARTCLY